LQFLFFAIFSIIGKTSSFIGPFVSSAIIDRSGNTNMPFTFLLGLGAFSVGILWMVDVDKSRIECRSYLEGEATKMYSMTDSSVGSASSTWRIGAEDNHQPDDAVVDKD
jgi:hypothetical protein